MKLTLSWLKEYVDVDVSPEDLAEQLTMAGHEVEAVEDLGEGLQNTVVAQILDVFPHPNADTLFICEVTDGEQNYDIVCGATNMKPGDKVVLAKPGTVLPSGPKFEDGMEIKRAKIRGEVSEGLLCAENEIGLGEEGEGIMILPDTIEVGAKATEVLGLDDAVFDISVSPNRPDCLSVVGIAREVSAILGKRLRYPDLGVREDGEHVEAAAEVEVLDSKGCPRYSCRVVKGVEIAPSPLWLKSKLETCGVRSINNIVDVTNLVLLELGQPLHAFDYDLVEGHKIVVRSAEEGESIRTLDDVDRTLSKEDLLICDARKPIALAGVMGGADTEVSGNTRNVLIESAYFDPVRVRKTSKKFSLTSESSYRFERGVDPNGVLRALDRAAELMRKLSGGKVEKGAIDVYPAPAEPKEISLSFTRTNSILGTDIQPETITEIVESLLIEATGSENGNITLRIPTFRVDLEREIDIIEELARLHGYEKIPATLPSISMKTSEFRTDRFLRTELKEIVVSQGFLETINYSFEDPDMLDLFGRSERVELLNPLTREGSVMRTNLIAGIMRNISLNLNRQAKDVRLFEIGKAYLKGDGQLPREVTKLAAAATGSREPELWSEEEFDFFDLKGVMESLIEACSLLIGAEFEETSQMRYLHPGKSAIVKISGEQIGYIGEIHPDVGEKLDIPKNVYAFELDLDRISKLRKTEKKKFTPLPKYPSIRRDIALVVDESVSAGDILREINGVKSEIIEHAGVFDVFRGGGIEAGKKSVAVSLTLRASEKTLTDEEAAEVQERAISRLKSSLGAELRT